MAGRRDRQAAGGTGDLTADWGPQGFQVTDTRSRPVWALLTGRAEGTNRYAWVQVADVVTSFPAESGNPMAASGNLTPGDWPAYEVNGRVDVPADGTKRVQLWPSPSGQFWVFEYTPIPDDYTGTGTGTGASSGTGDGTGCELPAEDSEADYADPWVLVDVSECWDEEEIWTWARQRIVCGSDNVPRIQYYGYRTEIHCCVPCGDHTGTGDADGSGTGTGDPCQGYCSEYEVDGITLTRWWPGETDPTAELCYWRGTDGTTTYVLYISNAQWGLINGDPGEATKGWTTFSWDGTGTATFVPTTLGGSSNGNIDVTCAGVSDGGESAVEGCECDVPDTLYVNFRGTLAALGLVTFTRDGPGSLGWTASDLPAVALTDDGNATTGATLIFAGGEACNFALTVARTTAFSDFSALAVSFPCPAADVDTSSGWGGGVETYTQRVTDHGGDNLGPDGTILYVAEPDLSAEAFENGDVDIATEDSTTIDITGGQSIFFTSRVLGGRPPFTFQWQVNGSDVVGETGPTWLAGAADFVEGSNNVTCDVTDANNTTVTSDTELVTGTNGP